MLNVLMVAEPFGYGPAATLLKCRRQLDALRLRWRYLGPEYTQGLIEPGEFEDCEFLATGDAFDTRTAREALAWADVVFSGTEFGILGPAARMGKRIVILDPLFWFWPRVPPVSFPGMTYICLNFPGVSERVASLSEEDRSRCVITAPSPAPRRSLAGRDAVAIVNFCGLQNPVRPMDDVADHVVRCLGPALETAPWKRIALVGNLPESARSRLSTLAGGREPMVWSHARMQRELANASLLVTCPGLNSVLEAISLGTPVAFLPPMNNSQAAQLDVLQAAGLARLRMDWTALTGLAGAGRHPDPQQAFAEIARCVDASRSLPGLTRRLTSALEASLCLTPENLCDLAARQQAFVASLCQPDLPGLEEIWATRVVPEALSAVGEPA